jgi:4-hydroxythreonine-4-phosphate dehydrogenase
MPRILIIADDLTGAADSAIACASAGLDTIVALKNLQEMDADVVAIDADTRCLSPAKAAERISGLLRQHPRFQDVAIFKKVDSTLRGNVGAELASMLKVRREFDPQKNPTVIVLAPAFPATGRTTSGGCQLVKGRPLEETEIWRREGRRGTSHIPTMLQDAGLRSVLLDLQTVRSRDQNLRATLKNRAAGADVLVCDAETDKDLATIARAASALGPKTIWAGSAGLACWLPKTVTRISMPAIVHQPLASDAMAAGPTLFVVGSPSAASRKQAQVLGASSTLVAIPASDLLAGIKSARWKEHATAIHEALTGGNDVVVTLGEEEKIDATSSREVSSALAQITKPCAEIVGALVITGGETARSLLETWGITHLHLVREIETGVPLSIVENWKRRLPIVTKAGDFGNPQTLSRCQEFLRNLDRRSPASGYHERTPMNQRPIIAITMGDAAGVGPEIIMKALAHREVYQLCRPLVIGDAERLQEAGRIAAVGLGVNSLSEAGTARYEAGTVDCLDLKLIPNDLPWGQISSVAGDAAFRYIETAAKLATSHQVDAICTAPLNKEALHAGGHKYPGHTEMLAALTNTPEVSMMLSTPQMRVLHVTTHIGLLDAIRRIEPGLVERTIARGHEALKKAGITNPKIGVCGINPHAGENGLFGYGEEEQKIQPAIDACRKKGWQVEGPLPADTLFYRAQRGDFDLVIAMYHDQGHGPVKVLGLESGVNITVGLPVIRTSVDHGTAFDIAGTGKADERSMVGALKQAVQLARRK